MEANRPVFIPSPRLRELLDEFEKLIGWWGYYTPVFGYQRAVDRGEIKQGEPQKIDVGNSGTTARLLPGWLAGQGGFDAAMERMGREKVEEMRNLLLAEVGPVYD